MKTKLLIHLFGLLAVAWAWTGCVVHEHDHHHSGYYRHGYYREYHAHHVHGPGCGHVMRGGVWVTIP